MLGEGVSVGEFVQQREGGHAREGVDAARDGGRFDEASDVFLERNVPEGMEGSIELDVAELRRALAGGILGDGGSRRAERVISGWRYLQ